MTTLTNLISPSAMHSLGWALVHFLWQGTALAAVAAVLMAACRQASARYVVGICTLGLMLAAPVVTFLVLERAEPSNVATFTAVADNPRLASAMPGSARAASTTWTSTKSSPDVFPWLIEVWLMGIAFLSLRSFGGFVLLERNTRRQSMPVSARLLAKCRAVQQRLGLDRAIRFCECQWLQAPAVIGWFRPVVLLPITTLTGLSEDQIESLIAHELAHIQRFDAFFNVFQICVETVLFYHPAVWWLNRRIRAEREHCCDDIAIATCGNALAYARALTVMEQWRSTPTLVMGANGAPLKERIVRLLGLTPVPDGRRRVGLAGSILCLSAALIAGNTLLGIAYPRPTAYASSGMPAQLGFNPASLTAPAPHLAPAAPQVAAAPATKPSPATRADQSATPSAQPAAGESYIDAMKAAGVTSLDPDELIALKEQGVTPEYVREMHELGLHPDADGLVGLKVQGVTADYIKELRAAGLNPDEDGIIGLKVQGVNAEYVRGLKEVGIQVDADDIIGMKVQGVTPAYIRDLRAAGISVTADDVVALKVQGVTPAYVQGLHEQGLKPSADDIVGMRVQGVTPEYIRDIRALGLNPSADDFVGMKVQGVTAEYIRTLQSAGFKVSADDVIGAKVAGVTPEFIEVARKHGFQNLTLEKLIELKQVGVLDSPRGDI